MVAALVRAISNTNDLESTKGAVGTLHNLSMHKQECNYLIFFTEKVFLFVLNTSIFLAIT
jgi:hypothetical protein